MREIQPLESATGQAAGRVKTSSPFVLKTRICIAISMAVINRPRKNHITAQILAKAIPTPIGFTKLHPTTGVHGEHPETEVRGGTTSYTWEAKEVRPTAGSRQP
jgi:hypothetical protein